MGDQVDIVVIGAGFAGLGAAWQLLAHGFTDFVVLERAGEVGGTWRENTYPGAACDIRSDLYSFSFAPNPGWRHAYGRQPEILDYLRTVSHRRGIAEHLRLNEELLHAHWDSGGRCWHLATSRRALTARVLLSGHGPLIDPHLPDIAGLRSFAGPVFHSSSWDHGTALAGRRVAVIGTGASAIQIVPALATEVAELTLYQRTPPWIIPRHDHPTSPARRRLFAAMPATQKLSRAWNFSLNDARWLGLAHPRAGAAMERYANWHRNHQLRDPQLSELMRPRYRIGCKRVLVSDDFYPALQRRNVNLVTEPIARFDAGAIITSDGVRRPVDVVVCATGFEATRPKIAERIAGADGSTLAEAWTDGMVALRGATVPGFPNLFLLLGPNTVLAHNSAIYMLETQIRYVVDALRTTPAGAVVEATRDALQAYNSYLDGHLTRGVWAWGGCSSFYLDAGGRNTVLWPRRAAAFRQLASRFDAGEYSVR